MDSYRRGQVEMFVNVTGASEAEARRKLQDFRGDINAAIDSYLSEGEASVPPVGIEGAQSHLFAEDVPTPLDRIATRPFHPMPSRPTWSRLFSNTGGFGFEGMRQSRFPPRGMSPFVTQPRDIREIPIDWRDEEKRSRPNGEVIIEEIPATDETWPSSQVQPRIVSDDDDTPGPLPTISTKDSCRPRSRGGTDISPRQTNSFSPKIGDVDRTKLNEGDELEEEMLKAALEASQRQTTDMDVSDTVRGGRTCENQFDGEDDDFMQAVSQSLKTAEQEQALREGRDLSQVMNSPSDAKEAVFEKTLIASQEKERMGLSETSRGSAMHRNHSDVEDNDFLRAVSLSLETAEQEKASRQRDESLLFTNVSDFPQKTGSGNDLKWTGSPPARDGHQTRQQDIITGQQDKSRNATGIVTSPTECESSGKGTVKDEEHFTSLVADLECEELSQSEQKVCHLNKAHEKAAAKMEESEKQKSAKQLASHKEPDVSNESAVTIMLRLPDGARQGRRFLKSEPLQCVFNFVDATSGLLRGSYQLVRPYPRRVYSDVESPSSLQDLGLSSKYETVFVEVI